jgi:hypothetical protein
MISKFFLSKFQKFQKKKIAVQSVIYGSNLQKNQFNICCYLQNYFGF